MVTAFIRAGHMTFGFTSHNASWSKLLLERSREITFQAPRRVLSGPLKEVAFLYTIGRFFDNAGRFFDNAGRFQVAFLC